MNSPYAVHPYEGLHQPPLIFQALQILQPVQSRCTRPLTFDGYPLETVNVTTVRKCLPSGETERGIFTLLLRYRYVTFSADTSLTGIPDSRECTALALLPRWFLVLMTFQIRTASIGDTALL